MIKSKGKNLFIYYTISISFIAVILNSLINLLLTPFITESVGIEAYGFVSLAKNFVSYANIIMIALNSYASRYLSVSYIKGEKEKYRKYFSTVFISDFIIAGLIFACGLVCVFNLEKIINISPELISSIKTLFVLIFMTFYVKTISTVYLASGYVVDRLDLVNLVKVLSYVTEIVLLIFCYTIFRPNVWYVGLGTLAGAVVVFVGTYFLTKKMIPESTLDISMYSKDSFVKLVGNGIWNSANSLGNSLNSGLDLLMTNLMLTGIGMGQVSIAKTINNLLFTVYSTVSQPFQPSFLKSYSNNETGKLLKELKHSMKVCGSITNVIFAGFIVLGMQFYYLWIPKQDIQLIYILTVIALLPCLTEGCVYPLYYIYTLTVKNKIPCIITIIGGVINVGGMYILLKYTNLGIYLIVITTAVVMNFINLVTNPLYMCHCLKIPKGTFYSNILNNIISCIITVLVFKLIQFLIPFQTIKWSVFLLEILVYGVVGVFVQMFILFRFKGAKDYLSITISKLKGRKND